MISIEGAIDLHIHSHPCLFSRLTDDQGVADSATEANMTGVMLKCHHESTVSRARALYGNDLQVYGGIVLNYHVGGINPAAVEAALRLGAKEVWMPTIDARNHGSAHGGIGVYDVQSSIPNASDARPEGITVLEDGQITEATKQVLKLIAEYGAILGTSHLSKKEIYLIVKTAGELGVKNILITHPYFKVPKLKLSELEELVEIGAKAEFGYCTISPMWAYATVDLIFQSIKKLGSKNCVIVSDAGQRHNPLPPEALRIFAQCLFEKGLSEKEIRQVISVNPRQLLGIS